MQNDLPLVTMSPREQRTGLIYLILRLLVLPRLIPFCVQLLFPQAGSPEQNFALFLLDGIFMVIVFRRFLLESSRISQEEPAQLLLVCVSSFAVYQLVQHLLNLGIFSLMPEFFNVNDNQVGNLISQNLPLMAVSTVLLAPITEECLYRGLLFGPFLKKSKILAYCLSVPVFCAVHVLGYIGRYEPMVLLICFVQYIPAGLCLGWAYQKSGTILAPILIHASINAIGIFSVR